MDYHQIVDNPREPQLVQVSAKEFAAKYNVSASPYRSSSLSFASLVQARGVQLPRGRLWRIFARVRAGLDLLPERHHEQQEEAWVS